MATGNTRQKWCQPSQGNLQLRDPSHGAVPVLLAEWLWHFQRMRVSASEESVCWSLSVWCHLGNRMSQEGSHSRSLWKLKATNHIPHWLSPGSTDGEEGWLMWDQSFGKKEDLSASDLHLATCWPWSLYWTSPRPGCLYLKNETGGVPTSEGGGGEWMR